MIIVLIAFSLDYQKVYLMIGVRPMWGIRPCTIRRCEFPGQAGFSGASISRPFAVQEGEKSGAGEGGRHCFKSYINNRL